jgi:hypothetical protein
MTGYEAFSNYHVLKLHFTSSYDYFKYGGKCNINIESFEKRRDKYQFYKLSRKYELDEYKEYVISCLLLNDKCWAGTLLEDESQSAHIKRMATLQSLGYNFKNDCMVVSDAGNFNSLLKTEGSYPILLTMTLQKVINFETLCILNTMMNFLPMWERKIDDDIRWPNIHQKIVKYSPFIKFHKDLFRKHALESLK